MARGLLVEMSKACLPRLASNQVDGLAGDGNPSLCLTFKPFLPIVARLSNPLRTLSRAFQKFGSGVNDATFGDCQPGTFLAYWDRR